MSRINTRRREFNTRFRMSTVLHPNIQAHTPPKWEPKRSDYIDVRTISTRGSWPAVHMIDEDTFVQMAILAGHIKAPKRGK